MKFGQGIDVCDPSVDLEGQGHGSRSQGQKMLFQVPFDHLTGNFWSHGSHGSRSKVDLEGQSQRSRWPGQKCGFRSHLTVLQAMFKVMGQGQRLCGSRSKVKWVKPDLKVVGSHLSFLFIFFRRWGLFSLILHTTVFYFIWRQQAMCLISYQSSMYM